MAERERESTMLEEERELLRETLQRAVQSEIAPRAADIDADQLPACEALRALEAVGVFGCVLPESAETGGPDLPAMVLATEALAQASPATAWVYVVHSSASVGIAAAAEPEQKKYFLRPLLTGGKLVTFAFSEAEAGADFGALRTKARREAGDYVLDGSKSFISMAGQADLYLVLVRSARDDGTPGHSMLLVERDTPGFSATHAAVGMGMRGIGWGELRFEGCRLPERARLGPEGKGLGVLYGMANAYLIGAAALALGIAQGVYAETVRHLGERRHSLQESPIGSLEALQFRVADMAAKVEAIRSLVYRGSREADARGILCGAAKLFASEAALDVARAGQQLQGATGYTASSPMQRFLRDAFAIPLHFENNDFLRRFLGRSLLAR